jgi:hypothetical protein
MKIKQIIFLLFIAFLIYSCGSQLYYPASKDTSLQQQLISGRKLYVRSCSGCHNLFLPKQFTAEAWDYIIKAEMQERAKITDEERQLILQYLTSYPK